LLTILGLAVAVVAIVALNHPKGQQAANGSTVPSSSAASSPSSSKPTSTPKSTANAQTKSTKTSSQNNVASSQNNGRPALLVLNNTNTSGLASTAVQRFQQGGWTASVGGNFVGDILSTAAYYDPSVTGAQAAADALQQQFPAIKRVVQRFTGLPQGPIIVVLTTDYS
jgi:hypothetical protein